jgi:hypothetical protein
MTRLILEGGWYVVATVDDDHHLNVFISNEDATEIMDISEDNGGCGELPFRFTTKGIEDEYNRSSV